RMVLAAAVATTAVWSFHLFGRTPSWVPTLRVLVVVGGLAAAVAVAARPRPGHRAAFVVASIALVATMAGPAAYTWATVTTPHAGAIPFAGPAGASGSGPGGAFGRGGAGPGGFPGPGGAPPPRGAFGPGRGVPPLPGGPGGPPPLGDGRAGDGGAGVGVVGGILNGSAPTGELVKTLRQDAGRYT